MSLHEEPQGEQFAARLNWLRAAVLGANDGIISVAGLVVGVAAATTDTSAIATAGIAGVVAGAVSMALGEYVSVSSQRDTERALIEQERAELAEMPAEEQRELAVLLQQRGLTESTAAIAAAELTEHDALASHVFLELGMDDGGLANPLAAGFSSALAFTVGALLPLVAVLLPPVGARIPATFAAVAVALVVTGVLSARTGDAPVRAAVVRLLVGGLLAMLVTFGIGTLLGVTVG